MEKKLHLFHQWERICRSLLTSTEQLREHIPLNTGSGVSRLDLVITGHCSQCTETVFN